MLHQNLPTLSHPPIPSLNTITSCLVIPPNIAHLTYVGIPTRYGNFPAQWKAFWDQTGGLWQKQALAGKAFGTFVSTGSQGGGQELTAFQSLSVAIHNGMVFVPIGYQLADLINLDEVHGGSPWGIFQNAYRARLILQ